jgi:isocitrate lyase
MFNWRKHLDEQTIAKFQREVAEVIAAGKASTLALEGSTEQEQFYDAKVELAGAA